MRQITERTIRGDHAGEYTATRICAGQLAIPGRSAKGDPIRQMQAREQVHLSAFNGIIADRRVRPTVLLPFWHIAGFAPGAVTAAMGAKAAMACTVAVEEAIDDHYSAHREAPGSAEPALRGTVQAIITEEREHRAIGLEHGAEQAFGYRLLSRVIKPVAGRQSKQANACKIGYRQLSRYRHILGGVST